MEKDIKKNKPKTSPKRIKNSTTSKMRSKDYMNLFVINDDDKLEIVKIPTRLNKNYIETFGVLSVQKKEDIINWLNLNLI